MFRIYIVVLSLSGQPQIAQTGYTFADKSVCEAAIPAAVVGIQAYIDANKPSDLEPAPATVAAAACMTDAEAEGKTKSI